MDAELEKSIRETLERINQLLGPDQEQVDYQKMDPVAKMMLTALIAETGKIRDAVDGLDRKIADRFCEDFLPREKLDAVPGIALIAPSFKTENGSEPIHVGSGAVFSYKSEASRQPLNFIPVFNTLLLPYRDIYTLTHESLKYKDVQKSVNVEKAERVWIGIRTDAEIECLNGVSLLISGTGGTCPEHICIGKNDRELAFATMGDMEAVEMAEPFDAQQSSGKFFAFVRDWRRELLDMEDKALIYIVDSIRDRDLFKPVSFPKVFQQWLESETLDCFTPDTVWLYMDFPEGYAVPDSFSVTLNAFPVANVDVGSVTLTQSSPVAKLSKQENAFFLQVLETSNASHQEGFAMSADEVIIRDFDAACYHSGDLYRDVRNLYNRFTDDYYAFVEYNDIKDGEVLKTLRETVNRIGKSAGEKSGKFRFDSGAYVMMNINQQQIPSSVKVSFLTTQGKIGNSPKSGDTMENKHVPALDRKVNVVVSGACGADKASADEKYELFRYYTLTADRLYTKMDIEAFLRKEIIAAFGKEEFRRIFIKMSIEGAGGETKVQRGLYIDIEFKDRKNYEEALSLSFDKRMRQRIKDRSCLSMPLIVTLRNLDIEA